MPSSLYQDPYSSDLDSWLISSATRSAVGRYDEDPLRPSLPHWASKDPSVSGASDVTLLEYRSAVKRLARYSSSGSGDSNPSRSPLHMNLGFLKGLTERNTRKGSSPPLSLDLLSVVIMPTYSTTD